MELQTIPTYHAGIAQSKAYRVLKQLMADLLKKHGLTMMQWSILGLVYDAGKKGIRITDLAEQVDSTKAFITTSIQLLELRGLVVRRTDPKDTRSRLIAINPTSKKAVEAIEAEIRAEMRVRIYDKVTHEELTGYVTVLGKLASLDK